MARKVGRVTHETPGEHIPVNGHTPRERKPRERLKTQYGKVRLSCIDDLDGRTSAAKHARSLVAALVSDLGGDRNITEAQRQLIRRAAVIGAFIEDAETRWIAGEDIDLVGWLAAVNTQKRVLCRLGLERQARTIGLDVMQVLDNVVKKSRQEKRATKRELRVSP